MQIDIVFPVLPPTLDGIGDHTALLAAALTTYADVRVLTAQEECNPIPGASIDNCFSLPPRRGVREILPSVREQPPDWLVLQFNQFSYGRWGLNPYVPWIISRIRAQAPGTRIAVLFHEDFLPVNSCKNAVMTTWQRAQFYAIGRQADLVLFTIDYWADKYRSWFPNSHVSSLPVGSNIPYLGSSYRKARQRLGISSDTFIVGYFGSLHNSRLLSFFNAAVRAMGARGRNVEVLYVGAHGPELKKQVREVPVRDAGALPAGEVSAHFASMDMHLSPFLDGVSTRRGSFMAGLQHGVPTVATKGRHTNDLLRSMENESFLLSACHHEEQFVDKACALYSDAALRRRVGLKARATYERHFAWPVVASQLNELLRPTETHQTPLQQVPESRHAT